MFQHANTVGRLNLEQQRKRAKALLPRRKLHRCVHNSTSSSMPKMRGRGNEGDDR